MDSESKEESRNSNPNEEDTSYQSSGFEPHVSQSNIHQYATSVQTPTPSEASLPSRAFTINDKASVNDRPQTQEPSVSSNEKAKLPKNDLEDDARFVCNICLDPVKDAVVTVCGHLYCWPCLFRWLNIGHTTCPVCKAGVTKENVIPLYLQGNEEDPRAKQSTADANVPNRPSAHRPIPQPNTHAQQAGGMQFTGAGGGMAFSAGIGFFPSLFGLQFQNFAPPPPPVHAGNRALTPEEIQQNYVSQVLLMLGIFVLFCLLMV